MSQILAESSGKLIPFRMYFDANKNNIVAVETNPKSAYMTYIFREAIADNEIIEILDNAAGAAVALEDVGLNNSFCQAIDSWNTARSKFADRKLEASDIEGLKGAIIELNKTSIRQFGIGFDICSGVPYGFNIGTSSMDIEGLYVKFMRLLREHHKDNLANSIEIRLARTLGISDKKSTHTPDDNINKAYELILSRAVMDYVVELHKYSLAYDSVNNRLVQFSTESSANGEMDLDKFPDTVDLLRMIVREHKNGNRKVTKAAYNLAKTIRETGKVTREQLDMLEVIEADLNK
jgi:hypothetical protein